MVKLQDYTLDGQLLMLTDNQVLRKAEVVCSSYGLHLVIQVSLKVPVTSSPLVPSFFVVPDLRLVPCCAPQS